jgi:hypothetical protein
MKNSHKVTIFLASVMAFARAQATNNTFTPRDTQELNSETILSDDEMNAFLEDGVLQYNHVTNALHISSEDAKIFSKEKKAELMIKSIRHTFGPHVIIKVVPLKDMQLATQDRQM